MGGESFKSGESYRSNRSCGDTRPDTSTISRKDYDEGGTVVR